MRVVIDASAAIEIVLDRTHAATMATALDRAEEVLAPDLFVAEVTNTIWKYGNFHKLSADAGGQALEEAIQLPDTIVTCESLYRDAFLLARTLGKAAYDMFYLALARREDAVLMSMDTGLRREAKKQGILSVGGADRSRSGE